MELQGLKKVDKLQKPGATRQSSVGRERQFATIPIDQEFHIVKEGGPGSGAGRFRMRSRTPSHNAPPRTVINTIQYHPNDYDSVVSSNYGAHSHRKFIQKGTRKSSFAVTNETSKIFSNAPGPGSYDTNSVNLKVGPRATIGNSIRGTQASNNPAPDQYSIQRDISKPRVRSAERNAPRATIGKEGMKARRQSARPAPTPGPNMYTHTSLKYIGDDNSIHFQFSQAARPISAITTNRAHQNPGPQDYRVVDPNTYMKRSRVIPNISFTQAGKELESKLRQDERAKSPGPSNYRPKSASFLKKSPSCTIGNTKRNLMAPQGDRLTSPGPGDYQIERNITQGPKYHIANRYKQQLTFYRQPGPSDYNYDPTISLKKAVRVTIGGAPKVSCLIEREKSPGPQYYNPKNLNFKRRHPTLIFSREKRDGFSKEKRFVSPGPGSYFPAKWTAPKY